MSETACTATRWAERRLRKPAQFAAVAAGRGAQSLRGSRKWLAVSCRIGAAEPAQDAAPSRLGLTVARRVARRAVDRNLVKRVVREAMRVAAHSLDDAAAVSGAGAQLDIVVRLKTPLPPVAELPRVRLKAALRAEADALFSALVRDLRAALAALREPRP